MTADTTWQIWETQISEIDRLVAPIAKGAVSLEDLLKPVADSDEKKIADICKENQDLMSELIAAYESSAEIDRARIRQLFIDYDSFAWAVSYTIKEDSDRELTNYFIYISILDQWFDTRDFLLRIRDMVEYAKQKKLNYRKVMRDIAEISSTVDRFGWGTTRDILISES